MKYNNIRAFDKHLQDSSPSHFVDVYLVLSKDDFQRKQAVDLLLKNLTHNRPREEFNFQSFEANDITIEKLITELNSFSFFCRKSIMLLQNLEKVPKAFLERLETTLETPKLPLTLILSTASLTATTKLYKRIEKIGIILDIPEEKPWTIEKTAQEWLISLALQKGKSFSPQASLILLKRVGTDSATLFQELEKLLCYVGNRKEITLQDVQEICSIGHTENVWQLGEAIFKRDRVGALRISKGLLKDEAPFIMLLRQLRSQFETEYQIGSIMSRGGGVKEISEQFPKMTPFIIERHIQHVQSYGFTHFKNALLKIDEAELNFKNSSGDAEILNELLMVRLTL